MLWFCCHFKKNYLRKHKNHIIMLPWFIGVEFLSFIKKKVENWQNERVREAHKIIKLVKKIQELDRV